jgi:cell division protein FtsN
MDEQVTWKGQSFTLLVFGGIVFLCSIFFVLGMLVGRGQGKSAADSVEARESAKSSETESRPPDAKPTNSPYESIAVGKEANKEIKADQEKDPEPVQSRPPAQEKSAKASPKPAAPTPAPAPAPPKAAAAKPAAPTPVKMIYLQVNAVASDTAAKKQAAELQKAGFTSVIMGGDGAKPLYKVQVGPFANAADADAAKRKLEALGYKPIKK